MDAWSREMPDVCSVSERPQARQFQAIHPLKESSVAGVVRPLPQYRSRIAGAGRGGQLPVDPGAAVLANEKALPIGPYGRFIPACHAATITRPTTLWFTPIIGPIQAPLKPAGDSR